MHHRARHRLRAILAAAGAIALSTFGIGAMPATATPSPTISVSQAPNDGGTVTIKGSGFNGDPGIYLGVGPENLPGFYAGSGDLLDGFTHYIGNGLETGNSDMGKTAPMVDGSFSITLDVPSQPKSGLAIYTSKAHGQGFSDPSQNTVTKISFAAPEALAKPKLAATKIPDGGGKIVVSGTGYATSEPGIYIGVGPAGAKDFYAAFDSGKIARTDVLWVSPGKGAGNGTAPMKADGSFSVSFNIPAGSKDLAIFTSKAHNLGKSDPSMDSKLTIGSVPAPETTPEPSPKPEATPKPSPTPEAKPSPTPTPETKPKPQESPKPKPRPDTTPAPKAPKLSTSKVPARGGKITVTGSGFSTSGPGIYLGLGPAGLSDFYKASEQLVDGETIYISRANTSGTTAMGRTAPLKADGSFSVSVVVPAPSSGALALYTSTAHGQGMTDTSQNVSLKLTYGKSQTGVAPQGEPDTTPPAKPSKSAGPSAPTAQTPRDNRAPRTAPAQAIDSKKPVYKEICTANQVSGAKLSWGVKSSFRNYIRSGVAKGGWSLNAVSYSGSSFGFSAGSGSFDKTKRTGTVTFPGSIHFSGHEGTLDLALSNVRVIQSGPSAGTLYANVSSSDTDGKKTKRSNVAFAALDLSGLKVSAGAVSVAGAPATLTDSGATAFAGFYKAGDALDPLSFSLPLGQESGCTKVLVSAGTGMYAGTGTGSGAGPLAATGTESAVVLSIGGSLLLASGALLLMLRRPHRVRSH